MTEKMKIELAGSYRELCEVIQKQTDANQNVFLLQQIAERLRVAFLQEDFDSYRQYIHPIYQLFLPYL